jgi:hypothetical protein
MPQTLQPLLGALALLLLACAVHYAFADSPLATAGSMSLHPSLKASINHQEIIAHSCVTRWRSQPEERLAVGVMRRRTVLLVDKYADVFSSVLGVGVGSHAHG